VPCTQLAREAGDDRLVSIAALGALVGRTELISPEALDAALAEILGRKHPGALVSDLPSLRGVSPSVERPTKSESDARQYHHPDPQPPGLSPR